MKIVKAWILSVLLTLAATARLQAQTTESFTFTTNRLVPDGNPSGLSDAQAVDSTIASITSLKVRLKITGEFNGDLYVYLRHSSGFSVLLNRPGKTGTNALGYADSGFDITLQDGAANGDLHVYQNVVTPPDGSPLTGIWQPDGRNIDPELVTDASVRSTSLANFNGLNASGEWTLYLVDAQSGATNMLTEWGLDITGGAMPAMTWPAPADIVYGTALSATQLDATVVYNSSPVPGTFTYTPAAGTVLNAGDNQTLTVVFTPDDTGSFLPITNSVMINVQQAPLTITALDTNKVYGEALPPLTASYSGFVNGEDESSLTTPVTLSTTATSASPAGTYAITAGGAVDPNYAITYVNGTLTITKASLTITAQNASKAYGQALPTFTATYSGFVPGEDTGNLTNVATVTTIATATSSSGTYSITASGATSPNYSFVYVDGTLTVTQSVSSGSVISSANPALPGASVTFTATLNAVAPGAGAPDGSVNFRIDGSVLGSGTLSGGVATFATSTLSHGPHTVVAEYAGSQNFVGTTNSLAQSEVINTPPVAGDDVIQRYPTGTVKVSISTLLANDSDADGDTLNFTPSSTSSNGGTITVISGWVVYTPAAGYTNADSFTYTITDGQGGSAVGTVTVAIQVDNTPSPNLIITSLGNNSYRVDGNGIPGRTYRLQYSDSGSPFNWQDLPGASLTADSLGRFTYTDTSGGNLRFYRSVSP